jgi:hypothetical protein
MSQYLGGVPSGGVPASVFNFGTTDIPRGRVVSLYPSADPADYPPGAPTGPDSAVRSQGYGAGHAYVVPIRNWVVTTQDIPVGVSNQLIRAGDTGTITIYGFCIVETDGAVADGDQIQIAATGIATQFVAGSKFGRALFDDSTAGVVQDGPVASTATYVLAFVDFFALLTP